MFSSLNVARADEPAVAILELNRPQYLNALSTQLSLELTEALGQLASDRTCRAAVITGAGGKAFCAGADLKERQSMSGEDWRKQHAIFEETFRQLRAFEKPVIAAVSGFAVGGGLEIAMSTDLIVADHSSKFGQPEVKRGILPGSGGTQLLPRLAYHGAAVELLLTGDLIVAAEAYRIGLVNHLYKTEELLPAAVALAGRIARNSPLAVRQVRRSVRLGGGLPIEPAIRVELDCYEDTIDSPDRFEGIAAFLERRTPNFADI